MEDAVAAAVAVAVAIAVAIAVQRAAALLLCCSAGDLLSFLTFQ